MIEGDAVDLQKIAEEAELPPGKVKRTVSKLASLGAIDMTPTGEPLPPEQNVDAEEIAEELVEEQEHHRAHRQARIKLLTDFAKSHACRRHFILNYFGEPSEPLCNNCDNCNTGQAERELSSHPAASRHKKEPFAKNDRVAHKTFGPGIITATDADSLTILFDTAGPRRLNKRFTFRHHLLHPES